MSRLSARLSLLISIVAVISMALVSFAVPVRASGTHTTKYNPATCKKATIKPKGLIKYSDWQFPDTLNPYQTSLAVSSETLAFMFDGLSAYLPSTKLYGRMATTVPTVKNGGIKDGGKTIVWHLKKGMHWSNGAEITSKDVKFGWRVDSDKVTGPACSGSCDIISRIDTPDKYTAIFHLKKIYAPAVPNANPEVWPTKWGTDWNNDPHAAAEKLAQDQNYNFENSSYPTNGAYQVKEFVNNDRIVLSPMKHYNIMQCGSYLNQVIFAFYSSKASLIAGAAARQTDFTTDYTVADLPTLKQHTDAFKILSVPGFTFEHLELNQDKLYNGQANPVSNVKVRLAMALALDKFGLIQSALGVSNKYAHLLVGWTPWVNLPGLVQAYADTSIKGQWDPIQKKYDPNTGKGKALADAKKLLSQTPYKNGFTVDFFTTSGNPVRAAQVSVITANWSRLGIKVNPNYVPASKLFADWDHGGVSPHGSFQVEMFAYTVSPEPDGLKYNMQSKYIERERTVHPCPVCGNDSAIHDKAIDKAFDAAAFTFNSATRAKNYKIVQVHLNQNADWIPLYFRPHIDTTDGKVANLSPSPYSTGGLWNAFEWRTKG